MASDDKHALPLTPPPSTDLPQVPFPPLPGKEAATVSPPASPLSDLITTHRRPLSDNEMSYFLPSRERGVNDMYVHHRFLCSEGTVDPERVVRGWAVMRSRHPLLASRVEGEEFVYDSPANVEEALDQAKTSFEFHTDQLHSGEDLIRAYLNGPRQLSASLLSKLVFSLSPSQPSSSATAAPDQGEKKEEAWDVLFATTHYVGDGMALHAFMNEFYTLIFGGGEDGGLEGVLEREKDERLTTGKKTFPVATETLLGEVVWGDRGSKKERKKEDGERAFDPRKAWKRAAASVALRKSWDDGVGGQTLARRPPSESGNKDKVTTCVSTYSYSPADTKAILAECKKHGVGVAQVVVAGLNAAFGLERGTGLEEPSLFYSAMSVRHLLPTNLVKEQSYFHLALGYYTLSLPSFLLPRVEDTLWLRAQGVKRMTKSVVGSRWVGAKAVLEMEVRGGRARRWAEVDDAAAAAAEKKMEGEEGEKKEVKGLGFEVELKQGTVEVPARPVGSTTSSVFTVPLLPSPLRPTTKKEEPTHPQPAKQNVPLLGVSMLGNLDGVYKHPLYSSIHLEQLTTGSRQRRGASLVFAYTFAGRLWLNFGWEMEGLGGGQGEVGRVWGRMKSVLEGVLLGREGEVREYKV